MKLYKRSLSLLLVCLLCFGLFSVNAYAVEESENLVDSNLSNWVDCGESLSSFQSVDISSTGSNNIVSVSSNSKGIVILYDLTEFLKVGESYEFTFTLPNTNNTGLGSYSLRWYLANSVDGPVASESKELVVVNSSNKSDFLGKTTTYEFTYTEGYKNTCLALYIWGNDGLTEFPSTNFYINDVSLTRVTTESEKKLDGILGWLEDIKNSITGLGDKLTSVWENITNSVSSLGDRISGFFDNLITNVKTFFEELPHKIFNYEIEVPDDDITNDGNGSDEEEKPLGFYYEYDFSTFDLSDYISSASGSLYAELFSNNVLYLRAPLSNSSSKTFRDFPTIPSSNFETLKTYVFEFTITNFNFTTYSSENRFVIYLPDDKKVTIPINDNGVYQTSFTLSSSSKDFRPSYLFIYQTYSYCISDVKVYELVEDGTGGDTGSDNEGTTTKVSWFHYLINKFKSWFNSIIDSVKGFFIKLVDDIKGLFIPSDGYFEDLSNRFDLLIEHRFGALVTITDYLVEFFSSFNADVTKEYFDVPIININLMGYNFPIGGWQVRFVPQFNGVEILTNACKFISSVLATFAFFDGLKKKYHEVFGGGE